MISAAEIQRSLRTKVFGQALHTFDVVESTNNVAKKLAESGAPEGTTVIAEYQTAGRGRFNRRWHGERGKNLLFSLLLRPEESRLASLVTYLAANCAAEAVEEHTGKRVECKWPNDLLINGRKFCGILLESAWQESKVEYLILGIGMNVNEDSFPPELRKTATSLKLECEGDIDRVLILRTFLQCLESSYLQSKVDGYDGILEAWKARCPMLGREISVEQSGRKLTGRAIQLDPDGALVIENDHRKVRIFAGDVTVIG